MAQYSILYARTPDAVAVARVSGHTVVATPDPAWLAVVDAEDSVGELVESIADTLGIRAVSVEHHSVTGWVQVRSRDGEGTTRTLSYSGGGDGWEVVSGAPEPWESQLFDRADADPDELSTLDQRALDTRTLVQGARVPSVREEDVVEALGLPDPWRILNPPGIRWNVRAIAYIATWVPIAALFGTQAGANNGWGYGVLVGMAVTLGMAWLYRRLGGPMWLYVRTS